VEIGAITFCDVTFAHFAARVGALMPTQLRRPPRLVLDLLKVGGVRDLITVLGT
jgi:hypothetical protein